MFKVNLNHLENTFIENDIIFITTENDYLILYIPFSIFKTVAEKDAFFQKIKYN